MAMVAILVSFMNIYRKDAEKRETLESASQDGFRGYLSPYFLMKAKPSLSVLFLLCWDCFHKKHGRRHILQIHIEF